MRLTIKNLRQNAVPFDSLTKNSLLHSLLVGFNVILIFYVAKSFAFDKIGRDWFGSNTHNLIMGACAGI